MPQTPAILLLIQEKLGKRGAVRTRLPVRKFLAMAALASRHHGVDVETLDADLLRHVAAYVFDQPAEIAQMKLDAAGERIAVAGRAGHPAMRRFAPGVPVRADLVTPGAALACRRFVINAGGRQHQQQAGQSGRGPPQALAHHR
jgi:hypothetical protein